MTTTRTSASPPPGSLARDLSLAAAGVTVLLWASAFVGIRAIGDTFSPGPLALGRLLVGAVALSIFVAWGRLRPGGVAVPLPRGRALAYIIGYGVLWFGGYNVALNAGELHVDAGTAALLVQTGPILIAVFAGLFLGEGFPRTLVAGITIAFCGVALISVGTRSSDAPATSITGVLLCLLAAVLYAAGVLLQKPALRSTSAIQATWLGCMIGAVACLPYAPRLVDELSDSSSGALAGLVYLGVFPTALAFTTWAYALSRIGAGKASATTYLVPAVATLMSWGALGETPTMLGLAGGAICLLGVAVTRLRSQSNKSPTTSRKIA